MPYIHMTDLNGKKIFQIMSNDFMRHIFSPNNKHSNILSVFFTFTYYLLLTPFRFHKNGVGRFEIKSWGPQKVLCGVSHGLCALQMFTSLRKSIQQFVVQTEPNSFFSLVSEASSFVFKLSVFSRFWRKVNVFQCVINLLSTECIVPHNPFNFESVISVTIVYSVFTALSFLRVIFGTGFESRWQWAPTLFFRLLVTKARSTFFISNSDVPLELSEVNHVDIFIAVIQGMADLSRSIVGIFVDALILAHVCSLWAATSGFTNDMGKEIIRKNYASEDSCIHDSVKGLYKKPDVVFNQYEALKKLSFLVSHSIGESLVWYHGEVMFFYVGHIEDLITTSDLVLRLVITFFYSSAMAIHVLSGEIVRRMHWFRIWLGDQGRYEKIPKTQLMLIIDELDNEAVAINASGVYTVNYSFGGTVVGVLITYFIIRLQSYGVPIPQR